MPYTSPSDLLQVFPGAFASQTGTLVNADNVAIGDSSFIRNLQGATNLEEALTALDELVGGDSESGISLKLW